MSTARTTVGKKTSIDLFCGAGGLSTALEEAGFHTVAAVDNDPDSIATLELNQASKLRIPKTKRHYLGGARLLCHDIRDLRAADLKPVGVGRDWRPDLLAGGPPCQPFSSAGLELGLEDPRGTLFVEFVRLAAELKPRAILFENVAGLVTAKGRDGSPGGALRSIQSSFEEIGYACRFDLLNSADFGAPQRRVRLYMIAARRGEIPRFPVASHSKHLADEHGRKPWVTLRDFLQTQGQPDPKDVVVPSGSRAKELAALVPGSGLRTGGLVEANRPSGHWGYRQDSFLADLDLPSRTIRAASTPDWVRLRQKGKSVMRRLTWRECAGIQSFPDQWSFAGTRAACFRQIGNAVQGHIGRAIGAALFSHVEQTGVIPISAPWPASFRKRVRYTEMEAVVNGAHRSAARAAREKLGTHGRR